VDFINFTELADANLDEDPLVVFPCLHALVISSADAQMDMRDYYVSRC
jgi:hypothetical protein